MRPPALLFALLIALTAAGNAQAALVPVHHIAGTIEASAVGKNQSGETPRLTLLTGQFDLAGSTRGLLTAAGTLGATVESIDRVVVFNTKGKAPPTNATGLPPGGTGQLPQTFLNVSLTVSDNSTLVYYTGDSLHNYTSRSDFALVVPLMPPNDLGGLGLKVASETSLAVVGPASMTLEMVAGTDALLAFGHKNVNVTVWRGTRPVANFSGNDWVYRLEGHPRLALDADSLLLPFSDDVNATIRPGDRRIAADRLDLNRVAGAYQSALPNATGAPPTLDPEVGQQVRQASAIFNGVLLGNPKGNATLGGRERDLGPVTLYRFESLALSPGSTRGEIHYEGSGAFLLAGDQLYTTKAAAGKSFPLPVLAIVLWVLAAAALVLGFVLKPIVAPGPANASRPVRLSALVFHLVMIPLAFVLWDAETHVFLGTSILTLLFGGGGSQGVAFSAVAGVQGLSFLLAWTYFGLPIRFLVNTTLKLMQMKRARGLGKGLSYLTAWGLGAGYYALLLNPFIGLFVDSLGGIK
jgi:hypothetical protein